MDLTLAALAQDVKAALLAYYPAPPDPSALPDRTYVSDGTAPAWDCEQATVSLDLVFQHGGELATQVASSLDPWVFGAEFSVQIVRCSPRMADDGTPPDPADIEAVAAMLHMDALAVHQAVLAAVDAGFIGGCKGVVFLGWTNDGSQGGYVGGTTRLRLGLE